MKAITLVSRILLGLIFVVFGLNGFLHFLPSPMPPGVAGQFFGALYVSHYLAFIFLVELLGGLLVLSGRFLPLGLAVLAPVLVNIVLFHACMLPHGAGPAIVAVLLWIFLFVRERRAFAGLVGSGGGA